MPLKTFDDENVCVIYDKGNNTIVLLKNEGIERVISSGDEDAFTSSILGIINLETSRGYAYVDRVWAEKGWGPLLYFIAMALYQKNGGIAPSRRKGLIKQAAKNIWYKMFNDERIKHVEIEPVFNEPQLDSLYSFADQSFLNNILSSIKFCVKSIPRWMEDAIEIKLSGEMDKVYEESRQSILKIIENILGT